MNFTTRYNNIDIYHKNCLLVEEIKEGNNLVIKGITTSSPREPYILNHDKPHVCPICSLALEVKHTDVLILSQFVRSDGCMLPRRITGLCRKQQKKMSSLVTMAQKAGIVNILDYDL